MDASLDTPRTMRRTLSAVLVGVTTVAAWLAVATGITFAVQAAWGTMGGQVPVALHAPAFIDVTLPCVEGWSLDGSTCEPSVSPDQWPGGQPLPIVHSGGFVVAAGGGDPLTAVLSTTPAWSALLAGGVVALVLVPVVRTTASGRPFARGNARRLATAAVVVAGAWLLATVGPWLAAPTAIGSVVHTRAVTGADVPAGWLTPTLVVTWWPLLIVGLLAVLAAASRSGARLAAETEGLV